MLSLVLAFLAVLGMRPMSAPDDVARTPSFAGRGQDRQSRLIKAYGRLPLGFEPNVGQSRRGGQATDARGDPVKYLARGRGYSIVLDSSGLAVPGAGTAPFSLRFLHSNREAVVEGEVELPGRSNYFIGNDPSRWRVNIPNYSRVRYRGVYPGVDAVLYGSGRELEWDFIVAPGSDPKGIALAIETGNSKFENRKSGIQNLKFQIDAGGDVVVPLQGGEIRLRKPTVYQELAGVRKQVSGSYVLRGNRQVGFKVGAYDATLPLVIDPVLSYSTFLGGGQSDIGYGVAADSSGNAYVAGSTGSIDFPTLGPAQSANAGNSDAFIAKLAADGSSLVYSTYLGGNGFDRATSIAVDSSGNAYVTGFTASADFPTTSGAFQTKPGGNGDAFIAKLNPSGSSLVYSTYLGGGGTDSGQGIAVDGSGNAFVSGSTASADFPTASALQAANAGATDAFVAKLNAAGSALVYSTYVGGGGADSGLAIALDSSGNAYVAGFTASTNFPVTAGTLQAAAKAGGDAFVFKLDSAGASLLYSTYLGGSGFDRANALAVDSSGNAFVAGFSASTDFPTTAGALKTTAGGNGDAFVTKLNALGTGAVYSTYLGGGDVDEALGVAVDASGNAFLTGYTRSSDFPVLNALQASFGGGTCGGVACLDGFVTELNAAGAALVYSTFLGGSGADVGESVALDSSGNAYVTGSTMSPNFPATAGAFQPTASGGVAAGDVFVTKVAPVDAPAVSLLPVKLSFGDQATNHTSAAKTVTLSNFGSASLAISSINATGDFAQTNACGTSVAAGDGNCSISVTFTPAATGNETGEVDITDNAAGSPHKIVLTGNGVTPAPAITLSPNKLSFSDQSVGTTSALQTVTLTNSGTAELDITNFAVNGEFAQTNNCPAALAEGANCTITVTFTPTATGSRTGSVVVTDNATGSPQSLSLSGNGVAVFSIASDRTSATLGRDAASTTFTISASAPSGFTSSITLSCTGGSPATCAFSPASINIGQTSTLTVSGLTSVTATDSLGITVNGVSGQQTATVGLTVLLGNFLFSASPPLVTVKAGDPADYTLTFAPINGFTSGVSLFCVNEKVLPMPQQTNCSFTPSSVTPDGMNPSTVKMTITTTARSLAPPGARPRPPFPPWIWIVALATLTTATFILKKSPAARATFVAIVLLYSVITCSCNDYFNPIVRGPAPVKGTPAGVFTVVITAKAANLTHTASVNLAVE